MKHTYLRTLLFSIALLLTCSPTLLGQIDGDIGFVGFNADGNDDFALVLLTDLDGSSSTVTLYITEDSWNGTTFPGTEGTITWTINSLIPGGTVINFRNVSTTPTLEAPQNVTPGSLSVSGTFDLADDGETMYVYLGSGVGTPTTFLTALSTDGDANVENGTGISYGFQAVNLSDVEADIDVAQYNSIRSNLESLEAYQSYVNDANRWVTQNDTGDQSADGTSPDAPFKATYFATLTAFDCPSLFYQTVSGDLKFLTPFTGQYSPSLNSNLNGSNLNGGGYNDDDNFMYANARVAVAGFVDQNDFIRIAADGSFEVLGNLSTGSQGDVVNDTLWFESGSNFQYIPDISTLPPSQENLSSTSVSWSGSATTVRDVIYIETATSRGLWGGDDDDLYFWNLDDFTVTRTQGVTGLPSGNRTYGAAYTDDQDRLYLSDNAGGVYWVDDYQGTPTASFLNRSDVTSNNDGFACHVAPSAFDADEDLLLDPFDLDADGDGIPNDVESDGTDPYGDADGDMIYTYLDTSEGGVDANGDGIVDSFDFDGDGVPNFLDLDSDNDGIYDFDEASQPASTDDDNDDGVFNSKDADWVDVNMNDIHDPYESTPATMPNTDEFEAGGDLLEDVYDLDSDADGCSDVAEAGFTDGNEDGFLGNEAEADIVFNLDGMVVNRVDGYTDPSAEVTDNTLQTVCLADPTVSVYISVDTVFEDDGEQLIFQITRTGETDAITVNYSIGGTAVLNTDYTTSDFTGATGTLSMAAGTANSIDTLFVTPTLDSDEEDDESVIITITSGTGYVVSSTAASATGVIANDDPNIQPSLDLNGRDAGNDVSLVFTEGDGWTTLASQAIITDLDDNEMDTLLMVFSGLQDGDNERMRFNGERVDMGTDESGVTTTYGNTQFNIKYSADTTTFTIVEASGGIMREEDVELFIQDMEYRHVDEDDPTDGDRVITITVSDDRTATSLPNTITINVNPVNDPPEAANNTVTTNEDTVYVFSVAEFNYSDPAEGDAFAQLRITTLETEGELFLDANADSVVDGGEAVTLNQNIALVDIPTLTFKPALNGEGSPYDSFGFDVNDGSDYSSSTYTMTINVTAINDLPTAAGNTVTTDEDIDFVFSAGDFNFSDVDGDVLAAIEITTLETTGELFLDGDTDDIVDGGEEVTLNQVIPVADIPNLKFRPRTNESGSTYDSFQFEVNDGAGNSTLSYSMAIDVNDVNDAPATADATVDVDEDGTYTFTNGDFAFSDVNDAPNNFQEISIASLPASGTLSYNGTPISTVGRDSYTDRTLFTFDPVANESGVSYATFTFRVVDDGSIANSGVDSSGVQTITIDVNSVNDAPATADATVDVDEDGTYTFTNSNFAFSDANDAPDNF
ncbi:MAG TPA: hypothetical protein DCR93_31970, partial [Cytophagales bacterium]|nr:hypothetical protein [Cytophagales bacterium]